MASPDTNPQSEEFERYGKFRVEVVDAEVLYQTLIKNRLYLLAVFDPDLSEGEKERYNGRIRSNFTIGQLELEEGLLKSCGAYLFNDPIRKTFSCNFYASYQNSQQNGDWSPDEAESLKTSLADMYGANNVRHYDLGTNEIYTVDDQVEETRSRISIVHASGYPDPYFINMSLQHISSPAFPMLELSTSDTRLKLGDQTDFIGKMNSWGQFIERTVNSIAKVKKTEQEGTLTLGVVES